MATLTQSEVDNMRRGVYVPGRGKEEIKTLGPCPQWRVVFQVLEDLFEGASPVMPSDVDPAGSSLKAIAKARVDLVYGQRTTAAIFDALLREYFKFSVRRG